MKSRQEADSAGGSIKEGLDGKNKNGILKKVKRIIKMDGIVSWI
jgi:hypothetical protein